MREGEEKVMKGCLGFGAEFASYSREKGKHFGVTVGGKIVARETKVVNGQE